MLSPLRSQWSLGGVCVPNRIVMAPMRTNRVDPWGHVTPELSRYLVRRARGGCGMIILESSPVDTARDRTGLSLHLDAGPKESEGISNFQELVSQLHSWGTVVVAQLWHAGPRAHPGDDLPLSPSGTLPGFPPSRALSVLEIENLIQGFVKASEEAANLGCDAVEIHAAHGYLLHHFIDRVTNRRKDLYGGSLEGRYRILEEICLGIKTKRPGFPVILRISLREDEDFFSVAEIIRKAGFDAVDLRTGFSSLPKRRGNRPIPEAYTLPLARKLRPHLALPLMTGGRVLRPEQAERMVLEEGVEAVVLGRPLLADPDWAIKAFTGQSVIPCLYDCEPSCYTSMKQGEALRCIHYDSSS